MIRESIGGWRIASFNRMLNVDLKYRKCESKYEKVIIIVIIVFNGNFLFTSFKLPDRVNSLRTLQLYLSLSTCI